MSWNPDQYGGITETTVSSDDIWLPKIELINQDEMKNYAVEYSQLARLKSDGTIDWNRAFRATTTYDALILKYPFDSQICELIFASREQSSDYVKLRVVNWNKLNRIFPHTLKDTTKLNGTKPKLTVAQHRYWQTNNEWEFAEYHYKITDKSSITGYSYSTLTMTLKAVRYTSYYELTLFVPVIVLAILSTTGLILPGNNLVFISTASVYSFFINMIII